MCQIGLLGDVTADPGRGVADGGDGVIDGLLGAAGEEHVRAFGGHPLRGRQTDAGGSTRDECGLAVELAHDELHPLQEEDPVSASPRPSTRDMSRYSLTAEGGSPCGRRFLRRSLIFGGQPVRCVVDGPVDGIGERQCALLGEFEGHPRRGTELRIDEVDVDGVGVGRVHGMVDVHRRPVCAEPTRRALSAAVDRDVFGEIGAHGLGCLTFQVGGEEPVDAAPAVQRRLVAICGPVHGEERVARSVVGMELVRLVQPGQLGVQRSHGVG